MAKSCFTHSELYWCLIILVIVFTHRITWPLLLVRAFVRWSQVIPGFIVIPDQNSSFLSHTCKLTPFPGYFSRSTWNYYIKQSRFQFVEKGRGIEWLTGWIQDTWFTIMSGAGTRKLPLFKIKYSKLEISGLISQANNLIDLIGL